MNYEKIVENTISYSINITNNKVDSLRKSNDSKTVIRVYDEGKIGIAGAIGECDENSLLEEAQSKLAQGIPYPCNLTENAQREEFTLRDIPDGALLLSDCKKLVERLSKTYPDYIFSNKINTEDYTVTYTNTSSTRYVYRSNCIAVSLAIKAKDSVNIMDLGYGGAQDYYSEDQVVEDVGTLLNVYKTKCDIPEDVPVLIDSSVLQYLVADFIAEKYMSDTGLLCGKLGSKIFNDKLNLVVWRNTQNKRNIPFFDCEGTVLEGDEFSLVKDGVMSGLITYKRSASNYNLPLSGSATADFDAVPSFGATALKLKPTSESLKEIVGGKAIYVAMTSGGDMTPSGDLGLPVLLAYVYEDGKLLGTLPEFSLSGNIFDVLGDSFLGVAKNDVFKYMDETLIVTKFKINK